jgi:glycosyltransferase involved in cell wall biosynthesis
MMERSLKKIVIVFIIDSLTGRDGVKGGTERQLIELISYLDREKYRPILFHLKNSVDSPILNSFDCESHFLDVQSLISINCISSLSFYIRYLITNSVDIVQAFFFDSTIFGVLGAKLAGVKRIISCRRDAGFWYNKVLLRSLLVINKLTSRILVNSKAVKDTVIRYEVVSPEKIDVIHNGLDLSVFDDTEPVDLIAEIDNISNNDKVIGMVANFNREVKRVDLFIMAAEEVVRHHKNVKFLIIGGGKLENELKELIRKLNLEDIVILGGKKDPATPYIKSFDIGLLTSDSEGFSNVLLEYMAAGIPSIATDVGGNKEIIQNGELGILVPKGDVKAIASSINTLLSDPVRCQQIGLNARKHIERNFTWESKIKEIERYYERLLEI